MFLRLRDEAGEALFARLAAVAGELQAEVGHEVTFEARDRQPFSGVVAVTHASDRAEMTDEDQLRWIIATSNRLVSALRLRLALAE